VEQWSCRCQYRLYSLLELRPSCCCLHLPYEAYALAIRRNSLPYAPALRLRARLRPPRSGSLTRAHKVSLVRRLTGAEYRVFHCLGRGEA
jgi:hypothetical protein